MATSSNSQTNVTSPKNLIERIFEDKKRILAAIKKGEKLSSVKGIKIVSPL